MTVAQPAMGVRWLGRDECMEKLAADDIGRLVVVAGGAPVVFPVNYVVDGETLVFRTDEGTKLSFGPRARVAFEIDGFDRTHRSGWSVLAVGRLEEVTPFDRAVYDRVRALIVDPWAGGDKAHWMRLVVDRVTGRAVGPPVGAAG